MLSKFFKRKIEAPTPSDIGHYKRFNDAVFTVRQDTDARKFRISSCNERAIKITGFTSEELAKMDFRELLTKEIREIIDDYFEFESGGRRIDEILLKIANFRIVAARGHEIPVKLRILSDLSTSHNINYQIVMSDISLAEMLQERRRNHIRLIGHDDITDLRTGLPNRDALLTDIELIAEHGKKIGFSSSFAVISFGDETTHVKRAGKMLDVLKRDSDIIGAWSENIIIFVMPDTPLKNAKTPLLRLKNSIPDDLKTMRIYLNELDEDKKFEQQVASSLAGVPAL